MLGNLVATDTLPRWIRDLAGLVTFVVALASSLLPDASHDLNVVNDIYLQGSAEVSLHEERTLIQTPSPNHKKKWVILVNKLPTPTHDRTPHQSVPSPTSPPSSSPNTAQDCNRPVVPLTLHDVGLSGANSYNTRDRPIDDSFSHFEMLRPVADRVLLTSMDFPASRDRVEGTLPEVIVEHASGFSGENDTFSLPALLSGEPEENLLENQDMEVILKDISGDGESEFLSFKPEELMLNACVLDRSLAAPEKPDKALGLTSTFNSPLAPPKSEELSTPIIFLEELSVQAKSVSIPQQHDCLPLITVSAIDDSHGANDTFSLTDLLSSFASKEDNLLNVQEMRDDLMNISMPGAHDSAALSTEKAKYTEDCAVANAEDSGASMAGSSSDHSIGNFISNSKEHGRKRQRSSDGIIYTSCGPFNMAEMPYELFSFSPASMRASEVASSLLSNEGRIRCADWRDSVDRGQQLLRVEEFTEEFNKDLAEFDKMQATLRSLMREHGLETSATPPRVPSVQIIQASPDSEAEKHILDRSQIIQKPYQFPAFLEKAVPLTIDFNACSSSLVASESVDSMYDPDFPGLDGKQANKYPKLNSDWPSDFPTEADTSDEWKLTQEMIDFWAARKAKMEAENPPPPVNIADFSMKVDDGGENDRTFADFDDSGEYNYEDEQCLPGSSRLKCLGWRYEVIPITAEPPQEPREHLVETVGNAILNQMYSVYAMYGQSPDPIGEASRSPSPPPSSPPKDVSPLPAPVVEPITASVDSKESAPLRRQSTSKVAPTTRALRPRPSASVKTAPPERPTARISDPTVLPKLRPRASVATSTATASRATIEKKVVKRQSIPPQAPKPAPRQSLTQSSVAPRVPVSGTTRQSLVAPKAAPRQSFPQSVAPSRPTRQSLVVPKVAPRQSLPQSKVAPKVSVTPPRTTRQSLAVPKAAPRQSLPQSSIAPKVSVTPPRTTRQSLATAKAVSRQSLAQVSVAPKVPVSGTSRQSLAVPKAAPRQSLPQSSDAPPKVSVASSRPTRQSLVVPKVAPRQSLPLSSVAPKVSATPPRTTGQSLAIPKAAPRQSLAKVSVAPRVPVSGTTRQSLAVPKAAPKQPLHIPAPAPNSAQAESITTSTLRSTSQAPLKSNTSIPASQTQTQPKSLAAVKRAPLAPIQTNVLRPSLPSSSTTALTQKSAPKLRSPKRMSLAPPPAQTVPVDAPKRLASRPSLTRPPARTIVSRR